jgi:hypothetical protein
MANHAPSSPDHGSDWFWELIGDADRDRERLAGILSRLKQQEIVRFHHDFKEAAAQLTDSPFTDHMEDLSEDGTQDVAEWVVSQGKEYYSQVWNDPEMIPKRIESGNPSTFSSVADNVYWDRFNQSIPVEEG